MYREIVVHGLGAAPRAVDVLIGDDERAGAEFGFEGANCTRREHLADTQRAQRPEVGAVVDAVWREAVVGAVPRDERHLAAGDHADDRGFARRSERRTDLHAARIRQERVEAGTTEHTDISHTSDAKRVRTADDPIRPDRERSVRGGPMLA